MCTLRKQVTLSYTDNMNGCWRQWLDDLVHDNQKTMSVEEKRALKTMEVGVMLEDGNYKLELPWREENASLPKTKCPGGTLIFTFILCMSYVYYLKNWCMTDGMSVFVCVWVCFAWEMGLCFVFELFLTYSRTSTFAAFETEVVKWHIFTWKVYGNCKRLHTEGMCKGNDWFEIWSL